MLGHDRPVTGLRILGGVDAAGRGLSLGIEHGLQGAPSSDTPFLDGSGLTVSPGFLDIQINGAFGSDFTEDPASIWTVGARLPSMGVTAFCPTIITSSFEHIVAAQQAILDRPTGYVGAEPIGLHIEGPLLAPAKRGTHPEHALRTADAWSIRPDGIRVVTVAPEVDGVIGLIPELADAGIVVSLGHSEASAAEARAGLDAGATLGTHLFNAMPPVTAREPGLAGVLLADERAHFSFIVDGHHHDPATTTFAWNAAPHRFTLITDGTAALGMPDGAYRIGSVDVSVEGKVVRNAEGDLAGAATPLVGSVSLLMEITGAPLDAALRAVTFNPSEAIRSWDRGRIRRGARADFTLLDGFDVVATIVGGQIAHLEEPDRLKQAM